MLLHLSYFHIFSLRYAYFIYSIVLMLSSASPPCDNVGESFVTIFGSDSLLSKLVQILLSVLHEGADNELSMSF